MSSGLQSQELKNKSVVKKIYEKKIIDVFSKALLTKIVIVPLNVVGSDIKQKLEKKLKNTIEGLCIAEGFIKTNSVKILTYSSGKIVEGNNISFEIVFECEICLPVEGMLMESVAKNITKAGIRAEINSEDMNSPVIIFIARDHHYNSEYFSSIKPNDSIKVRVIGQRFELNDKYISVIAELIEPKKIQKFKKPKLILKDQE